MKKHPARFHIQSCFVEKDAVAGKKMLTFVC